MGWYAYYNNNPLTFTDPDGKQVLDRSAENSTTSLADIADNICNTVFGMSFDSTMDALSMMPMIGGPVKLGDEAVQGVWKLSAFARGWNIEKALGGMCNNMPVIDNF